MIHCIIVGFANWDKVATLMSQLCALNVAEKQIHFVDNLQNETTEKKVRSLEYCRYYSWGNIGYGSAINRVLRQLTLKANDLYLFMNDDIVLRNSCVETLVNSHERLKKRFENVGVISPTFASTDCNKDSSRYFRLKDKKEENYIEMEFGPAATWLVDYTFLKVVGGFYPRFFMFGEDEELLNRGTKEGFKHFLIQDAIVIHDFSYPPINNQLRLMKETNIMSAHYLNTNDNKKSPHIIAIKGLLVSFSRGQFLRFKYIVLGYLKFLAHLKFLKHSKVYHKNDVEFRYLT